MANVMVRPWVKYVGVLIIVAAAIFGISKFAGVGGDDTSSKSGKSGGLARDRKSVV